MPRAFSSFRHLRHGLYDSTIGDYGETKDDLVFMFGMSVEPDKVVDNLPVGQIGRAHV